MKRFALLLLASLLVISLYSCESLLKKAKEYVTGNAESVMPEDYLSTVSGEEYSYDIYRDYIRITAYNGSDTMVRIPSTIEGKPVRVIGSLTFFDCKGIMSVTIPDTVNTLEDSAFYYSENLLSITVPDSVTRIGTRAFAWCNSLESITIGSGITAIPDFCFNHCTSLEKITIPSNVTSIGVRAFSYCDKLAETELHSGITEIKERAFSYCAELLYVTINNGSCSLGDGVFEGSAKAAVIAQEGSGVWDYCVENSLRWSDSKSVEAVIPSVSSDSSVSE